MNPGHIKEEYYPKIAVLNFKAVHDISLDEADLITAKLEDALAVQKNFKLMTRASIKDRIGEKQFQEYMNCEDASCAMKVGKAIQADHIALGKVGKSDKLYYLSIELVKVEKDNSYVSKIVIRLHQGSQDGLLTTVIPSMALELAPINVVGKMDPSKNYTVDLGNGVQLEMIWIPDGTFQMGRSEPSSLGFMYAAEDFKHTVELDGFWMGKYEVTQEQYERIMGSNPSHFKGAQNPVENVSWDVVTSLFCEKLSQHAGDTFALPTEAQWEYACRAGCGWRYCFGNDPAGLDDYAWYNSNSGDKTHPVGQKRANAFGLYDMHGNVDEWCADFYDDGYYAKSPRNNPENMSSSSWMVLRGGSWHTSPSGCRSCSRNRNKPLNKSNDRGFRVVRVPR
ncbi:SUMF1/EgtB/PvdO family nonheme iron enzyme [Candidatus Sumerlaeota bacterium]|nr:SUMF1/EgtB/PvdO family nonheme iron enzyme [Candidatus Sumerlaeota bacterium]